MRCYPVTFGLALAEVEIHSGGEPAPGVWWQSWWCNCNHTLVDPIPGVFETERGSIGLSHERMCEAEKGGGAMAEPMQGMPGVPEGPMSTQPASGGWCSECAHTVLTSRT